MASDHDQPPKSTTSRRYVPLVWSIRVHDCGEEYFAFIVEIVLLVRKATTSLLLDSVSQRSLALWLPMRCCRNKSGVDHHSSTFPQKCLLVLWRASTRVCSDGPEMFGCVEVRQVVFRDDAANQILDELLDQLRGIDTAGNILCLPLCMILHKTTFTSL